MPCVADNSPCWIAGADIFYDILFTNDDDTPKNLTGAVATMDLKDNAEDVAVVKAMNGGIVDAINGAMRFTLTPAEGIILLPRPEKLRLFASSVKIVYQDATIETILTVNPTIHQVAPA